MRSGYTHGSHIEGSDIMQPMEIQGSLTQTVQTHNAQAISANSWSSSPYMEATGFNKIAVTASMVGGTGMSVVVDFSHDGVNYFAGITVYDSTGSSFAPTVDVPISAKYFRVGIKNKDATNAKTTSAYAFLKV
jgi:hypothetical protein